MSERKSILKDKSFLFAVRIVKLHRYLIKKKDFDISRQILRSGTAIGALIREAQNAESKKDFIHKLGIAQKECDETIFWLELLFASQDLTEQEFSSLHFDAVELYKMIISSIITTRKNMNSGTEKND